MWDPEYSTSNAMMSFKTASSVIRAAVVLSSRGARGCERTLFTASGLAKPKFPWFETSEYNAP